MRVDRSQEIDELYWYDSEEEQRFVDFCAAHIKLIEGQWAGKQFILQKWQRENIYGPILSWKQRADNLRRFRSAFITMARKNAKTTATAALLLYSLIRDNEHEAENYVSAQTEAKAKKLTRICVRMVQASPWLTERLIAYPGSCIIEHRKNHGFIQPVSSEAVSQLGGSPHIVVMDEFQEQKTDDLQAALQTGFGARSQPLLIMQGTAGDDIHSSAYEEYQYAKMVLKGDVHHPTYFSFIAEADRKADPFSVEAWKAANPGYPFAPSHQSIEEIAIKARRKKTWLRKLRQFHCNQWVQDIDAAIDEVQWEACGRNDYKLEDFPGKPLYLGIDLADQDDLTCLCFMLINDDGIPMYFPFFYGPEKCIEKNMYEHNVPYDEWAEAGDFTPIPGIRTDYKVLAEKVADVAKTNPIKVCHYDKHHSYYLVESLEALGIELVEATQACGPMNACTSEVLLRITEGRLIHPHNAVLTWNAMNARTNENKHGKMFDKKLSHKKIDGMVAMALATRGAISELTGGKEEELNPTFFPDS